MDAIKNEQLEAVLNELKEVNLQTEEALERARDKRVQLVKDAGQKQILLN